jgi:DNA polymerase
VGALIRMGALDEGLEEDELKPLVKAWRKANKKIVAFWYDLDHAALKCVSEGVNTSVGLIKFSYKNKILYMQIPSGRRIAYIHPVIKINSFGSEYISYEGVDQTTKQWKRLEIYGGKFAENCVQATARDLLVEKLYLIHKAGHKIAIHVHDEVVVDTDKKTKTDEIHKLMIKPVIWAKGLPLNADTFESAYYKKD